MSHETTTAEILADLVGSERWRLDTSQPGATGPVTHSTPAAPDTQLIETGTTTIALTATDGVVLAADRRASIGGGRFVSNKQTVKIESVHPTAALTLSGAVGGLQSFTRTLRAEVALYERRRGESMSMRALSTRAGSLLRNGPFMGAMPALGGIDAIDGPQVFDIDGGGAVLSAPYVAGGSGMQLAYGVLERDFEHDSSVESARRVAARAVESALERDTASGNGLTLATVTDDGVAIDEFDNPAEVV